MGKNIFADSAFQFTTASCDCLVDIVHPLRDITKYTFRLYPKDDHIYYSFIAGKGLVSKKRDGAADGKEVLPDLVALKEGDAEAVKRFFEKYGFLFPLNHNIDYSIESDILFVLINRLKATVSLMSALGEVKIDYKQILALMLYLLLTEQVKVLSPSGMILFETCPHVMCQVWYDNYELDENDLITNSGDYVFDAGLIQDDQTHHYQYGYVKDSVRPTHSELGLDEVYEAQMRIEENSDSFKHHVVNFFQDTRIFTNYCRLAIDFLYHFCKDVGEIEHWSHDGELIFADSCCSPTALFKERFDEQLQEGLLKLAKHTLKTEIEYNIRGIVPSYDTESMSPSWRVDNLLSGLYFSVFYMRPKLELYRTCANPNCNYMFLVSTTSSKKKYCSHACGNSVAQRNHQRRKKEKLSDVRP